MVELDFVYKQHLLGVAEFLDPSQARRFITLANGNSRKHEKLFRMLYHDLRPQEVYTTLLRGSDGFPEIVYEKLLKMGAPEKAVMLSGFSENGEVELKHALTIVIGNDAGTIISCIPGRLVFWESDDMNYRYILCKT